MDNQSLAARIMDQAALLICTVVEVPGSKESPNRITSSLAGKTVPINDFALYIFAWS